MDATPPSVNDALKLLAGGAVLAAYKLLRAHFRGRKAGEVFARQRQDGREARVIPRPQEADVNEIRNGLLAANTRISDLETRVDEQGDRLSAVERTIVARVDAHHSETQADVKQLIGQVGVLNGQVALLVEMQSRRRSLD